MRLIDADALKRKAQKVATEAWKMRIKSSVETILNQFIDWIDNAPTIEERKTGMWEKQRETYCSWTCSVCKEIVVAMPEQMGYPLYDYCPHCGSYNGGNR